MEYTKGEWKRKGNVISVDDGDGDEYIIAKLPNPLDGGAKSLLIMHILWWSPHRCMKH
jgi:hypothetical protein